MTVASILYERDLYVEGNKSVQVFARKTIIVGMLWAPGHLYLARSKQKRLYNRETIATLNYDIQQMSFIPPFPSMHLKYQPILIK